MENALLRVHSHTSQYSMLRRAQGRQKKKHNIRRKRFFFSGSEQCLYVQMLYPAFPSYGVCPFPLFYAECYTLIAVFALWPRVRRPPREKGRGATVVVLCSVLLFPWHSADLIQTSSASLAHMGPLLSRDLTIIFHNQGRSERGWGADGGAHFWREIPHFSSNYSCLLLS